VVVTRHEAVAQTAELVGPDDPVETAEEVGTIRVEGEDRPAIAPARVHVVDPTRNDLARQSAQVVTVEGSTRGGRSGEDTVTLLARI
jgi:hypothetical protein